MKSCLRTFARADPNARNNAYLRRRPCRQRHRSAYGGEGTGSETGFGSIRLRECGEYPPIARLTSPPTTPRGDPPRADVGASMQAPDWQRVVGAYSDVGEERSLNPLSADIPRIAHGRLVETAIASKRSRADVDHSICSLWSRPVALDGRASGRCSSPEPLFKLTLLASGTGDASRPPAVNSGSSMATRSTEPGPSGSVQAETTREPLSRVSIGRMASRLRPTSRRPRPIAARTTPDASCAFTAPIACCARVAIPITPLP
jgi:hypothetical protein